MSKILKTHPKSVQSHKDLILQCLDDKDESIRLRALDLLYGMVRRTRQGGGAFTPSHHIVTMLVPGAHSVDTCSLIQPGLT